MKSASGKNQKGPQDQTKAIGRSMPSKLKRGVQKARVTLRNKWRRGLVENSSNFSKEVSVKGRKKKKAKNNFPRQNKGMSKQCRPHGKRESKISPEGGQQSRKENGGSRTAALLVHAVPSKGCWEENSVARQVSKEKTRGEDCCTRMRKVGGHNTKPKNL